MEIGTHVTIKAGIDEYAGESGPIDSISSDGTLWVMLNGLPLPFAPHEVTVN
jgi:hypothetical protein